MFSRNMIICLGVTGLSSLLLYMYVRNKVNNVENKLDLIYQLIETHSRENEPQQQYVEHSQFNDNIPIQHQGVTNTELITVSDDDNDNESDDDESDDDESDDNESDDDESDDNESDDDESDDDREENKLELENDVNEELNVEELDVNVENDEDIEVKVDDLENLVENEVSESIDYTKLKVKELKKMARDKGLFNYSSLKKNELIQLLNEN